MSRNLNIILVGPKHSGKTVFLAALAHCPPIASPEPESIAVIKEYWRSLRGGQTPPATAGIMKNLSLIYSDGRYNVNFDTFDYDGHFVETLSHSSNERADIRARIKRADGFIIFVPADSRDEARVEEFVGEVGSFISSIREAYGETAKIEAPVVLAANKWDKSPDFQAADEDAAAARFVDSVEVYSSLRDKLANFFQEVLVLPLSAYGHKCSDDRPDPGRLAPYRVIDPVVIIVESFFKGLAAQVEALRVQGDWPGLYSLLDDTREIWRRTAGHDYSQIYKESVGRYFQTILAEVEKSGSQAEYDQLVGSPSARYAAVVRELDRESLKKMKAVRAALARREVTRKAVLGSGLVILLFVAYIVFIHFQRHSLAEQALGDRSAPVMTQLERLGRYTDKYGDNALLLGLYGGTMEKVRARQAELLDNTIPNFENQRRELRDSRDFCRRAADGERLLQEMKPYEAILEAGLIQEVAAISQNGAVLCADINEIKAVIAGAEPTPEDFSRAETLIAEHRTAPEAAGVLAELQQQLTDKVAGLKRAEAQAAERAAREREERRVAALVKEGEPWAALPPPEAAPGYTEARGFLARLAGEDEPELAALRRAIEGTLPERFYRELSRRVEGLTVRAEDFQALGAFLAEERALDILSAERVAGLRELLQAKTEGQDLADIEALPEVVETQSALTKGLDEARRLKAGANYALGDGLFRYERPEALRGLLQARETALAAYDRVLNTTGVTAEIILLFDRENALKAGCGQKSAPDNNEISFKLAGHSFTYESPAFACRPEPGERGSRMTFGPADLKPWSGLVSIEEYNWGPRDNLTCRAENVGLSAQDILAIYNKQRGLGGYAVEKSLDGCPGVTLRLE